MAQDHADPVRPLMHMTPGQLEGLVDEYADKLVDRWTQVDAPVWEHQSQMARTTVSLASGGIIVSISVVQLIADKIADPAWSGLLSAAWLSWSVSVLAGLVREAWSGEARSFAQRFEHSRIGLRLKLRELNAESTVADVERLLGETLHETSKKPERARRVHNTLNRVAYLTFAAGIGALVAFAIKNFPL